MLSGSQDILRHLLVSSHLYVASQVNLPSKQVITDIQAIVRLVCDPTLRLLCAKGDPGPVLVEG